MRCFESYLHRALPNLNRLTDGNVFRTKSFMENVYSIAILIYTYFRVNLLDKLNTEKTFVCKRNGSDERLAMYGWSYWKETR